MKNEKTDAMLFLLLFLNIFSHQTRDDYYVSYRSGNVRSAKDHHILQVGERVHLNEQLEFDDNHDFVAVVNPDKGRYIIEQRKKLAGVKMNRILITISENIFPTNDIKTMAWRDLLESRDNLRAFLSNIAKSQQDSVSTLMIMDSLVFTISSSEFSQPALQYLSINKLGNASSNTQKLPFLESTDHDRISFIIDRRIGINDNKQLVKLQYHSSAAQQPELVGIIRMNFVESAVVNKELKVLYPNLFHYYQGNLQLIQNAVISSLTVEYGYIDRSYYKTIFSNLAKVAH